MENKDRNGFYCIICFCHRMDSFILIIAYSAYMECVLFYKYTIVFIIVYRYSIEIPGLGNRLPLPCPILGFFSISKNLFRGEIITGEISE